MAKMKKCLSQFKDDFVDSDSPKIVHTILAMDTSNSASDVTRRAVGFVDTALAEITTKEKTYREQLTNIVAIFKNKSLKANHYVSKKAGDPDNELGTFSAQSMKKLANNFFQRVASFSTVVSDKFINKHQINKAEQKVLTNVHDQFLPGFDKAIEEIFKYKGHRHFRKNDFIQYFVDTVYEDDNDIRGTEILSTLSDSNKALADADGNVIGSKLDPTLKGVIAATAYDYMMHNTHSFLQNNYDAMKKILNLNAKEDSLPFGAKDHLQDIGSRGTYLAEDLGKGMAARLGIKPGKNSDYLAQARLEKSLGMMALATLEHMGVLERLDIYTGTDSQGNLPETEMEMFGLAAIKAGLGNSEIFAGEQSIVAEKGTNKKGTPTVAFFRFKNPQFDENNYQTIPAEYAQQKEDYIAAPNAISKLYGKENMFKDYSFDQPQYEKGQKFRIGRSTSFATEEQAENIKTYNRKPWIDSAPTMNAFFALDNDMQKKLLGHKDPSATSVTNKDTTEGINLGIDQDIRRMKEYMAQRDVRKAAGQSTEIYIQSEFWNTMRMGQTGTIKPQGSKFHRALISMKKWKQSFKKTEEMDDKTTAFIYAVAQHLDIESGKLGGIEGQRNKFYDVINSPDGQEAVYLAGLLETEGSLSREDQERLVELIEPFETKALALKGLIEYARYQRTPIGADFTTDITIEVDGIGNGPAIGTVQLAGSQVDRRVTAASLAMAGWNFTNTSVNIDEQLHQKTLLDAYQRMGHIWGENVAKTKAAFQEGGNTQALSDAKDLDSIVAPLFDEEGYASSSARSLSKYRTMQALFGAGAAKQVTVFIEENIIKDGIFSKLEDFAATVKSWDNETEETGFTSKEAKQQTMIELKKLLTSVSNLTKSNFGGNAQITTNGKIDPNKLLELKFNAQQKESITEAANTTYGTALKGALDTLYGPINETRSPYNKSISTIIVMYNALLDAKIKRVQAEKLAADPMMQKRNEAIVKRNADPKNADNQTALLVPPVTNGEMKEIVDSLSVIFPRIRSPFYDEASNTGYLDLAHKARNHKDGMTARIEQSYASGTVSQQIATVAGYPYLEDSGVSPVVNSIHMLDSFVANNFIGTEHDILNVHDASIGGIDTHKIMEEIDNQAFEKAMSNFYLGKEFEKTFTDFLTEVAPITKAEGLSSKDYLNSLVEMRVISFDELVANFGFMDVDELFKVLNNYGTDEDSYPSKIQKYLAEELPTEEDKQKFTQAILRQLKRKLVTEATASAENKDEFMKNNTNMTQYSGGLGGIQTGNEHADVLFEGTYEEIPTATITLMDRESTDARAGDIKAMMESVTVHGSNNTAANTDINSYPDSVDIDSQSAVQVLNSIIEMDNNAGPAAIKDSAQHQEYLQNFVGELTDNVMRPLELYVAENPDVNQETVGTLTSTPEGKESKVFIQKQNVSSPDAYPKPGLLAQGIRMSTAETYAHELTHHMTHMVLSNDSHLRSIAKSLFNQTYKGFKDKYGDEAYRVFLNDPTINVYDSANRFEVEAAKARWNYIYETAQEDNKARVSTYDEFVAHGVTNENFMRELSTLDVKSPTNSEAYLGIFEKNIQTSLMNLFKRIQDFIFNRSSFAIKNAKADKVLNGLVQELAKQDGAKKNALIQYAWDMEAKATLWATAKDKKVREVAKKIVNKPRIVQAYHKAKTLPELDNMMSQLMRNVRGWYNDKEYGIVASMNTELKGRTNRLGPLHDLQHRRNLIIDMEKKEKASVMMKLVRSFFDRDLSSREKAAVTKAFVKTDLSTLYQRGGINSVISAVSSPLAREQRIQYLMDQIRQDPELSQFEHFFSRASSALGHFIVTGRGKQHDVVMMNAYNIARMADTSYEGQLTPTAENKVRQIVDEMASLHSLEHVSNRDMAIARALINENSESIENILIQHQIFKDDALQNNFKTPAKAIKGYTKAVLNPRIDFVQDTLANAEKWEAQGYIRSEQPLPKDPNDPEQDDFYLYKSTLGMAASFTSQIMSLTNNVARGTSSRDIQTRKRGKDESIEAKIKFNRIAKEYDDSVIDATMDKLDAMFDPAPAEDPNDNGNYMIPKYDDDGEISGMRYIMSEHVKDSHLEQTSDIDAVFSKLAETAVDKKATPVINDELVVALKAMYDSDFKNNPTAYVEISPYVGGTPETDRYKEIYHSMPPAAKAKILEVFPDGRMKVAKDVIDLAFGTRKYSFQEALNSDPKKRDAFTNTLVGVAGFALGFDPFGTSKYKNKKGRIAARVNMAENVLKQITMLAKNNIVVRNLSVVMGNYSSNIAYLKSRGLTMEEIQTGSMEAIRGAMEYESVNSALQKLQQERLIYESKRGIQAATRATVLKNMDRKINQLKNELELNPATDMMRKGLMTAIVDDIDTDLSQSNYEQGIDALLTSTMNKMPKQVQAVARTMFLTTDGEGYKTLNNGVKMTDFVGRYVLYNHYRNKKGMDHDLAFGKVNEEFVNFALPTHRMIEYGNNIGAIWFSKYQLRVLKQVLTSVADKPFTAISTFILTSMVGTGNILNSIPGITKDVFQAFGNPLDILGSSVDQIATIDAATGLLD